MELQDISEVISICKEHLSKSNSFNTEAESYLVQYALIYICNRYEQRIRELLSNCASHIDDKSVSSYVRASAPLVYRGLKIGELSKILGYFGESYRALFSEFVEDNQNVKQAYDNILTNRNAVAHRGGVSVTFGDLEADFVASKGLIEELSKILENMRLRVDA